MKRMVLVDPVTRIEGHAKVFLDMTDDGSVAGAGLVVNELRGFERILVGMEADKMPLITARICGVCPSAHHLAAAKALDALTGVDPPPAGRLLRELLYMGHFIHSHALALFALEGPDLIMGFDADPAVRNIAAMAEAAPELTRKALRLRTLGQKINEMVGGRGVHPVTAVPGGITFALDKENHATLEGWAAEALRLVRELLAVGKELLLRQLEKHSDKLGSWSMPAWMMGTVQGGKVNFYDGLLRITDENGVPVAEFPSRDYSKYLVESVVEWSYMKKVRIRQGQESRSYRVGSLGRINCADGMETEEADKEFREFRQSFGNPCHKTLLQMYARFIELLYACEKAAEILRSPAIWGEPRVAVKLRAGKAVGHVEAPRGSLFHEYEVDEEGIVRSANLIVATQQNYDAINQSILQAAQSFAVGKGDPALLNAVEYAIRTYDPCLSCATHAIGRMPLEIVFRHNQEIVQTVRR